MSRTPSRARLLVLSSLFPSNAQPAAGVFIRERMFRVGRHRQIVVVAPQAWFPGQSLIRLFRPHFRPMAPRHEVMGGFEIHRPRFLSVPGLLKWADGLFMALSSYRTVRRVVRAQALNVLDVHFGYPDGYAGLLLGRWLGLPMMLTLRGKEERLARADVRRPLASAVASAERVIAVSGALRDVAVSLGADPARVRVVGNGIDLEKFRPLPRGQARAMLGVPPTARILVTVGTLIERKGFHRVIEIMPRLIGKHPDLHYLVVGGAGPEGDNSAALRAQAAALGLEKRVQFLGPYSPERLHLPLSAADLFVLASSYEGWANVLLEAMACGLAVVATDVGGNAQVVNSDVLGFVVPFGDADSLAGAIDAALGRSWDAAAIRAYAEANSWDSRIPVLVEAFDSLLAEGRRDAQGTNAASMRHGDAR
jgi:glycosyltransferase involved in cell wall biosynthesis